MTQDNRTAPTIAVGLLPSPIEHRPHYEQNWHSGAAQRRTAPHVLLVDDHAAVRTVLGAIVARLWSQATIVEASDDAQALSVAIQQRPDLIITDYHMPIMGGLELVRTLRAQGATMPILVLSSDSSIAETVLAAGATAFRLKPFPLAKLRNLLCVLLSAGDQAQTVHRLTTVECSR